MKICFIGPANSSHIVKWCKWFTDKGHEVHVISFSNGIIPDVYVHDLSLSVNPNDSDFKKIKYLTSGRRIRKIVEMINPDIINVHYATSYGIAVSLSGLDNYILSVWGADVYDFPQKSIFHKAMLKHSLKKAKHLFSTSNAMANEASRYTNKPFVITPFGVDMELFNPNKRNRNADGEFIVGTVKGLSDKYGIADIIQAVAYIKENNNIPIKLRIAGKGPQEQEYRNLVNRLGIEDITTWLGYISPEEAAIEWANMDVAIIPSTLNSESFGVSAVEAQASGTAVIITDIPGLMEATEPGVSSVVVHRNNPNEIADRLSDLFDSKTRSYYSKNGLEYVRAHYELNTCFTNIENFYYSILTGETEK
ncbi:MAG: glycosyltransferase family 4 protein [Saccharofermentans sp.]|nr:glycosyltransferase family 4 protein [Saccharofermentans sp.]